MPLKTDYPWPLHRPPSPSLRCFLSLFHGHQCLVLQVAAEAATSQAEQLQSLLAAAEAELSGTQSKLASTENSLKFAHQTQQQAQV